MLTLLPAGGGDRGGRGGNSVGVETGVPEASEVVGEGKTVSPGIEVVVAVREGVLDGRGVEVAEPGLA